MIHKVTDPGQCSYPNCRDCGCDLWHEQDRKLGLCLHCLEKRVQLVVLKMPTLIVDPPKSNVRWN